MRQKRLQIGVMGSDGAICSPRAYKLAREVGREIASRGYITLTGGGTGVMEAACRGAKEKGGTTVGILPGHTKHEANPYLDVVVVSGMGFARNMMNIKSCEGVILVEGGVGTMTEAAYAYQKKVPVVALVGSGGTADELAGRKLDVRAHETIIPVYSPGEAVRKIAKFGATRFKRTKERTIKQRIKVAKRRGERE